MRLFSIIHLITAVALCHGGEGLRSFHSTGQRITVLELYSSEGCSSCPPADQWLSQLRNHPDLWTRIIPLSFHVDYWDHLGWKDPYATRAHSDRQRSYAAAWGSNHIYTPGFVTNGLEGNRQIPGSVQAIGALSLVQMSDREWKVSLAAARQPQGLRYHVALLGFDLRSKVTTGENRGRTLVHDFVVLAHLTSPTGTFTLDTEGAGAVAAWVSSDGNPTPLQATGGWLTNTH